MYLRGIKRAGLTKFFTFDGEKVRQTVEDNGRLKKTDYCGPFVYETASGTRSLKYIVTTEGRAVKSGSSWDYEYNLTDHLGNVRAVIRKGSNGLAKLIQQKHYYSSTPRLQRGVSCSAFAMHSLVHNAPGHPEITMKTSYEYDHRGRLLTEKIQMDGQAEVTLAATEYNKIGEPVTKYLHGSSGNNFNQQIDYTYNTRGWLRKMNQPGTLGDDLFALDLRYEAPGESTLMASAAHNGNISEMLWHAVEDSAKGYGFIYDELNRLTAANYGQGITYSDSLGYYNTSYGYDDNGNIDKLTRYMSDTRIDSLSYSYPSGSNQLESVTDYTGLTAGYYSATKNEYEYDVNGNMEYDPSKQLDISYNYLNLPVNINYAANEEIRYTYDASGTKLIKNVSSGVNTVKMDYSGPFLYENNSLKCIFTSAGRIVTFEEDNDVLYKFEYNLQDHLGNTHVVFGGHSAGKTELIQRTDYYPFGLVMGQQEYIAYEEVPDHEVLENKYLYNNKEWQDDEFGGVKLDWYDYGARMYDAELGRWHVIDNKAEKYYATSPYTYALNNPILFLDPDGNDVKISTTKNAQTGRTTVTFTVTMSVRNSSYVDDKVVMNRAMGVKNQIEKSYSGFNSKTNTEYVTKVTFDQSETDYILDFVNDVEGRSSMFTAGKVDEIGNTTENRMQVELESSASGGENQTEAATSRTGAHEYGHTLGLRHGEDTSGKGSLLKSKTTPNLMNQSQYTNSTKVITGQLEKGKATAERDQAIEIRRANNDKYSKNQY